MADKKKYIHTEEGHTIEVEQFTQWLHYMLTELVIPHQKLAKKLRKSKKTIDRYLNDPEGNFPKDEEKKQKIFKESWKFIREESCYETYHHLDNQVFLKIFRDYCNTLKKTKKISQKEIAEKIGTEPKQVSIWLHSKNDIKFSPEKQYQILNALLKFDIGKIYTSRWDAVGTFHSPYFRRWVYVQNYGNLFILMQNKELLSRTDVIMQSYIKYPFFLYRLIERQIENSLSLPLNSFYSLYGNLTYEKFTKILDIIMIPFRKKARKSCKNIPDNTDSNPEMDKIIKRHLDFAKQYSLFLTREQCLQISERLEHSEELRKQLFEDIIEKSTSVKMQLGAYQPSERADALSESMTEGRLLQFFSQYPPEMQALLLNYPEAFLDTAFSDVKSGKSVNIALLSIYYHFLKKIKNLSFSDISKKLEQTVFIGYSEFSMQTEANQRERLQRFYQGDDEYFKIACLADAIPEWKPQYYPVTEQNKKEFLRLYQSASHREFFPLLKILKCKLEFTKKDWLIWRLVMIGRLLNPEGTPPVLFESINSGAEVLYEISHAYDIDNGFA